MTMDEIVLKFKSDFGKMKSELSDVISKFQKLDDETSKSGNSFEYALRLLIACGKIITSGVKKMEATVKGEKYEYGTVAPISIKKNHLPSPFNLSRDGMLYCTSNGIISESEIDSYKKKILPTIIQQLKENDNSGKLDNITEDDIEFTESEEETL